MICNLSYKRQNKIEVRIRNLVIGGSHPIAIQSMADTSTNDIEGSVSQSVDLIKNGVQMVRFTTQGERELANLAKIKKQIQSLYDIPVVADVHFRSDIADRAVGIADKVRINPGNYAVKSDWIKPRFSNFLSLCKKNGIAVRIGVNHGSLSKRILEQYGNTEQGMVESCMEFLRIAREKDFDGIVLSVKASDSHLMYQTVLRLNEEMEKCGMYFPFHVGVTEAGSDEDGRIKSAVGIGAVIEKGLGDTIRVSLSEPPINEIPVARHIINYFVSPTSNRYNGVSVELKNQTVYYTNLCSTREQFVIEAAAECGHFLWDNEYDKLIISNPHFTKNELENLARDILQACGIKRYKNEYISCPGCGRTLFDLQGTVRQIKEATSHLTGFKIAVMGCIVNGIGEMGDADYGYVGAARGKISLYKGKECVLTNIRQEEAVEKLLALMENRLSK